MHKSINLDDHSLHVVYLLLISIRNLDLTIKHVVLEEWNPEIKLTEKELDIASRLNTITESELINSLHMLITGDMVSELEFIDLTRNYIKSTDNLNPKQYLSSISFYLNARV